MEIPDEYFLPTSEDFIRALEESLDEEMTSKLPQMPVYRPKNAIHEIKSLICKGLKRDSFCWEKLVECSQILRLLCGVTNWKSSHVLFTTHISRLFTFFRHLSHANLKDQHIILIAATHFHTTWELHGWPEHGSLERIKNVFDAYGLTYDKRLIIEMQDLMLSSDISDSKNGSMISFIRDLPTVYEYLKDHEEVLCQFYESILILRPEILLDFENGTIDITAILIFTCLTYMTMRGNEPFLNSQIKTVSILLKSKYPDVDPVATSLTYTQSFAVARLFRDSEFNSARSNYRAAKEYLKKGDGKLGKFITQHNPMSKKLCKRCSKGYIIEDVLFERRYCVNCKNAEL
jgi:hypothetical protein